MPVPPRRRVEAGLRYTLRFGGGCSSVGRVPDCDSGCRGFESHQPPHQNSCRSLIYRVFLCTTGTGERGDRDRVIPQALRVQHHLAAELGLPAQKLGSRRPCFLRSSLTGNPVIDFPRKANDLLLRVSLLHRSDPRPGLIALLTVLLRVPGAREAAMCVGEAPPAPQQRRQAEGWRSASWPGRLGASASSCRLGACNPMASLRYRNPLACFR